MGPLDSCASCASGGAVRAISPDLGESRISESGQSSYEDADWLKMRGFEPFLATSPFSHTKLPHFRGL